MEASKPNRIQIEPIGPISLFRAHQNRFLREFCTSLDAGRILNVGSYPNSPDKQGSTYEAYFPSARFETVDLGSHLDSRHVCDNIVRPTKLKGPYDLILAMSVLEHVERPWIAAKNIIGLLQPGGYVYLAVPFFYPIHEGLNFGDHWRCTPSAARILFDGLEEVTRALYPSAIVAVRDRANYWQDPSNSYTGFSMLLRRSEA